MTNALLSFRRAATFGALAAALLAAACGPHTTSGVAAAGTPTPSADHVALALGEWRPPSGQRCVPTALPVTLPDASQLVDAGAVAAVLSAEPLPDNGYALLSVKFDTTGEATRTVVIESTLPGAERERVAHAVANALRKQPPAAAPWGVRLRLDATTPPALRVGRSEWCDASRASGRATSSRPEMIGQVIGKTTIMQEPVHEPARWQVIISPEGKIVASSLLTATHYPDRVRDTQESLAQLRFNPALDDRVPVAVVDTIDYPIVGFERR